MNTTDPAHFVIRPSPVAPLASRRAAAGRDAATLTLELTAEDLRHFRRELDRARASVRSADDEELLELATEQIASLRSISLPAFVAIRIERLDQMRAMVADTGWHLDQAERDLIFGVLAYVCDPEDMIPDAVPGIGLLDDAVMIELAWRELRHEVEAHRESGAASA